MTTLEWLRAMDYCREKKIPPAQKWAWDMAKKANQQENNS
jgi:hypothetical protein